MTEPYYKVQLFNDTNSNWSSSNPVIPVGVPVYVTDVDKYKIGNGNNYNNINYANNIKTLTGAGGALVTENVSGSGNWVINVTASGSGNMLQANYYTGTGSANTTSMVDHATYSDSTARSFSNFPIGYMGMTLAANAPTNTLFLQGQTVSRTTYANLWSWAQSNTSVISDSALTTSNKGCFTSGDGSTTFRLPNMQTYIPVGYLSGDSNFGTMGASLGQVSHTHTLNNAYAEMYQNGGNTLAAATKTTPGWTSNFSNILATGFGENNYGLSNGVSLGGSTDSTSSIQPSIVVNYYIVY